MAAYFTNGNGWNLEWHVGEPIPRTVLTWKVVMIQADGHELDALLEGLNAGEKYER